MKEYLARQFTENEHVRSALKVTPPILVNSFTLFGHPLSDFALILTIVYTSIMIFVTVRDKIFNKNTD